jgi:hypothetical protein
MVDRVGILVEETSVSTGTGNFTLANRTARRSFNTAYGTSGTNKFYYFITSRDANEWEHGTGHLSAANTLVRDTVISSSNLDALVSFSAGTKDVVSDFPANLPLVVGTFTFATETKFGAGVDFLGGVSNSITLTTSPLPLTENQMLLFFDGVVQQGTSYVLAGNTVTFSTVIPLGVAQIEVKITQGGGSFTEKYTSGDAVITSGTAVFLSHGLSGIPVNIVPQLYCATAELGYSIGDVVNIACGPQGSNRGISVVADATEINIRYGSSASAFEINNRTTGATTAIANANWRLRITAWL